MPKRRPLTRWSLHAKPRRLFWPRVRQKVWRWVRSGENGQPLCARYDRQPPTIGIFFVPRIVATRRDDEQPIISKGGNRRIELLCWVVPRGNADKTNQLLPGRLPILMRVCVLPAFGLHPCFPGVAVDLRLDHVPFALAVPESGVSELLTPESSTSGDPRAALPHLNWLFLTDHRVHLDAGRFGRLGQSLSFLNDLVQQIRKLFESLELCLSRQEGQSIRSCAIVV